MTTVSPASGTWRVPDHRAVSPCVSVAGKVRGQDSGSQSVSQLSGWVTSMRRRVMVSPTSQVSVRSASGAASVSTET